MSKEDIITLLKKKEEHYWEILNLYATAFGDDNEFTLMQRARWCEYYKTLQELGQEC